MQQTIDTGGCKCGAIQYEFTAEPIENQICHCPDCRKATGAQSVAWIYFPIENFIVTSGTPTIYKSAPHAERTFCNQCGTSLTYWCEQLPHRIAVTVGSLDRPEAFPPRRTCNEEHKLPWASSI
jgi:hypothetical protein